MRSRFLLVALFLLAGAAAAAQTPPDASATARVDELFRKMDTTVTPGCALAVMKDGHIVYERGYGMADLDHNVPITPATVFHVASMSKQFTAASIVLLEQQGKLSFDDPVRKYVSELPDFGVPITIRQLVHHTSGLRDQWDLLDLSGWRYSLDLITDDDVLYVVGKQRELNFPPGSRHLYSNTGYTLLGQVVKHVSGQSLREFTTANIFAPLGMKNTHFRDDHAEIVKNMAYGYEPDKDTFRISITNFDTVGATSLLTTVEDLALWDENFYHPRVGGDALVKQMLERGKLANGEQLSYAFGLEVGEYHGLKTVDHGGADAGYRSDMIRFPDQHFSVACLCNASDANPSSLTRKVAEIYLDKEMKSAAVADDQKTVALTPAQLNAMVGTYMEADGDQIFRFTVTDGKPQVVLGMGDYSIDLKPIGENLFRLIDSTTRLRFQPAGQDGILRLTVEDDGQAPRDFSEVTAFAPSPAQLSEYAGVYRSPELDPAYELTVDRNTLVLHRLKNKPDTLQPVTLDLFSANVGTLRFTRTPQGKISGFLLNTGRVKNLRFEKSARRADPRSG